MQTAVRPGGAPAVHRGAGPSQEEDDTEDEEARGEAYRQEDWTSGVTFTAGSMHGAPFSAVVVDPAFSHAAPIWGGELGLDQLLAHQDGRFLDEVESLIGSKGIE